MTKIFAREKVHSNTTTAPKPELRCVEADDYPLDVLLNDLNNQVEMANFVFEAITSQEGRRVKIMRPVLALIEGTCEDQPLPQAA